MNSEKQLAFETALDRGKVRVVAAREHPDLLVPPHAKSFASKLVALDYSKQFHMPGFKVTEEGIRATLSFGGQHHRTFVPWDAVLTIFQNGEVLETWAVQVPNPNPFDLSAEDLKWMPRTQICEVS